MNRINKIVILKLISQNMTNFNSLISIHKQKKNYKMKKSDWQATEEFKNAYKSATNTEYFIIWTPAAD